MVHLHVIVNLSIQKIIKNVFNVLLHVLDVQVLQLMIVHHAKLVII